MHDAWSTILYDAGLGTSGLHMDDDNILSNASAEILSPLEEELWPDDPDDNPEYQATRDMILAASILAQLTNAEARPAPALPLHYHSP